MTSVDVYADEWDACATRGLAAWRIAHDMSREPPSDAAAVHRQNSDDKVREACDSFCTALQVVGRTWMRNGGGLDYVWMQRQLVTEKNIALSLFALRDTAGAVHYLHSAICVLVDMQERFGDKPWMGLIEAELRRFKSMVADRPADRSTLPPLVLPRANP